MTGVPLADDLMPALRDVVDCHVRGTVDGIQVDPADGLLRAGEPGVQVTWMDAKVGDLVVTPRFGEPVEIQALWYKALCSIAELLGRRGMAADEYVRIAERAEIAFGRRFLSPGRPWLADVVDGRAGTTGACAPTRSSRSRSRTHCSAATTKNA